MENFSVIDGVAVVTPVNVDDKYCFLQDAIKIPYSVHNGKYELEVLSSKDPVCVSTNRLSLDAKILTLTAKVKTNKMSNEEATKLQGKIVQVECYFRGRLCNRYYYDSQRIVLLQ